MSITLYGVDTHVALDPNIKTSGYQSSADMTVPIDFSDGASHTVISRTIPGGILGNYGFCIVQIRGAFENTVARTIVANDGVVAACTSHSLNADTWYFEIEYVLQNRGAENDQVRTWMQDYGRNSAVNESNRLGALDTTDTSADWTLTLTLDADGTATTARVDSVRVQTYYLP